MKVSNKNIILLVLIFLVALISANVAFGADKHTPTAFKNSQYPRTALS